MDSKNGYAKTRIVDFPRGNSYISGRKVYYIAIFPVVNSTMKKAIFPRGKLLGVKLPSDSYSCGVIYYHSLLMVIFGSFHNFVHLGTMSFVSFPRVPSIIF